MLEILVFVLVYFQVPVLSYLNLRNNLMGQVPFVSLGHVGSLKYLDLSNNRIAKIEDPFFQVRNRGGWLVLAH